METQEQEKSWWECDKEKFRMMIDHDRELFVQWCGKQYSEDKDIREALLKMLKRHGLHLTTEHIWHNRGNEFFPDWRGLSFYQIAIWLHDGVSDIAFEYPHFVDWAKEHGHRGTDSFRTEFDEEYQREMAEDERINTPRSEWVKV